MSLRSSLGALALLLSLLATPAVAYETIVKMLPGNCCWFTLDAQIVTDSLLGTNIQAGKLAATAAGTDMTVNIGGATGVIIMTDGSQVTCTAADQTIAAADATDPRIDLISCNHAGTIVTTTGTPASPPIPPALPNDGTRNNVAIALVAVPAGATALNTVDHILDKRISRNMLSNAGTTSSGYLIRGTGTTVGVNRYNVVAAESGLAFDQTNNSFNITPRFQLTENSAPSSPSATFGMVWQDTTDHRLHDKNPSGVIGTTVVADAGSSNNFVTAISAAGVVSKAQPTEANLSTSDITTNDCSTTKHGFAPKAPNDATKFLDGTCNYSTPSVTALAPNGAIFTATADGTNNAVASDTSIIGTGVGSKTTAANYFSAGTSLFLVQSGTISTAATPATLTIKVKAGSVVVCQTTAQTLTALLSSAVWEMNLLVTNRTAGASGTFKCNGIFASTGTALTPLEAPIADTGNAVDTTGTIVWDVTAVWGSTTAGDTITGTNFAMWTPGSGITDPGANGILQRTAFNTVTAGNPSLLTGYLSSTKTVDAAGVTANLLVKINSTGNVVNAVVADVGVLGVAVTTATSGNPVEVATRGVVNCVADNTTIVGNILIVGTTTAGRCRDSGQTDSTSIWHGTQVVGKALTAVSAGSNVSVQLYGPGHFGSAASDVQTFNAGAAGSCPGATTCWTKPAGALSVYVFGCGSGGGAAGGHGAAAGGARTGGGGGGGGFCKAATFRASDLTATVAVTTGVGGTSGAGGSSSAGTDGGAGNASSFGAYVTWPGGGGGGSSTAGGAGGGGGGCTGAGASSTTASGASGGACFVAGPTVGATVQDGMVGAESTNTGTAGVVGVSSSQGGASGGGSATTGLVSTVATGGSSFVSGAAGGAGGGVNAATPGTAQAGLAGGQSSNSTTGPGGGGAGGTVAACGSGGAGTTGTAGTASNGGWGGGGGASNASGTGCNGGDGGAGGGGGGGGGGGTSVGGNGGTGGVGVVIVISQ